MHVVALAVGPYVETLTADQWADMEMQCYLPDRKVNLIKSIDDIVEEG